MWRVGQTWHGPCSYVAMTPKSLTPAQAARKARAVQTRALAYTVGPYAVTCEVIHPVSRAVIAYGIGADKREATRNALNQI